MCLMPSYCFLTIFARTHRRRLTTINNSRRINLKVSILPTELTFSIRFTSDSPFSGLPVSAILLVSSLKKLS